MPHRGEEAAYDRAAYLRAAEEFVAHPNAPGSIAEMMRIALEGEDQRLKKWAAGWLKANCNVAIVEDTGQEPEDAATTSTAGIR